VNRVPEKVALPNAIRPDPNAGFLSFLLVALQVALADLGRRLNLTAPKDGSEPTQMVSYSSVDLTIAADLDNGDPGYFAVVRCNVTGAERRLSGLVDGLAQEAEGGRVVTIMNVSATFNLIVGHEDTGSTDINRFKLPRALDIAIYPEMATTFWYDASTLRWRVM